MSLIDGLTGSLSCSLVMDNVVCGEEIDFDQQIAPLIAQHCLECHSAGTRQGNLDLSQQESAAQGGDSGAAIVPGKPEESELWLRVNDGSMPHDRPPLSDLQKQWLKQWLSEGASWGVSPIDPLAYSSEQRAGRDWWSLAPLQSVVLPQLVDHEERQNSIDLLINEELRSQNIAANPSASRRTLLRRLSFDLTGLPPEPQELERFENDASPDAVEKAVDRLLASPAHGERWARHWLDVVRFGESQGYERNHIRENAWRYRDWVVEAFNEGVPYDRFVKLQLAGDVLHPDSYQAHVATGYHVCGTWDQVAHVEGSSSMRVVARHDHLEDLVASFGQAFLGLTVQCARCHDHKFDPITQRDYYQVVASLSGVHQREKEREGLELSGVSEAGSYVSLESGEQVTLHIPYSEQPPAQHVLLRGKPDALGDPVVPGVIEAIQLNQVSQHSLTEESSDGERRRMLAEWVTDSTHPLTARVIVNRWWHYHFGSGLVDTPSDFGFAGGRPSHPALLDHLATELIDNGWDLKMLHRKMVTSATYRRSSNGSSEASRIDAAARFRWRAPLRQLEGEAVRDAMLQVSGALVQRLGGPSFRDVQVNLGNNHEFTEPTDEFSAATARRTLYRLWARSGADPLLQSLDCPDPSVMMPRRPGTITPIQALGLQNGSFARHCAQEFARRLRHESDGTDRDAIRLAWNLALGRDPEAAELDDAEELVQAIGLEQLALALFNSNEFLFVD